MTPLMHVPGHQGVLATFRWPWVRFDPMLLPIESKFRTLASPSLRHLHAFEGPAWHHCKLEHAAGETGTATGQQARLQCKTSSLL